jgi:hypothetical protein
MVRRLALSVAAILAVLPAVAAAGTYIVTLHSGGVFESRYQPREASWDRGKVVFLSETGNWIALRRADIAKVESTTLSRGLGVDIDTTTIAVGWAPNDNLTPEQIQEAAKNAPQQFAAPPQPNYTMQQFVEPNSTQGMPVGWIGTTTPPMSPASGTYGSTVGIPASTQPPVNQ